MDSVYFGDKNSWEDFHLFPSPEIIVNPPKPITNYVDVGGVDGQLDLSTALTGSMRYDNRTGSWTFGVATEHWETAYHELANYLHGQKMRVVLSDDPGFYYMGRLELNSWKSNKYFSVLVINYILEPYKYDILSSLDDWLWDPFCFETDIIREYKDLTVNGSLVLKVPGSSRPCVPTITCSAAMSVSCRGQTYSLSAGNNRNVNILIGRAEETLTFTGSGTVSVNYRGGWL